MNKLNLLFLCSFISILSNYSFLIEASLAQTKISTITENLKNNDCAKIDQCKDKDGMVAYLCLYDEMVDKPQFDNTSCKKLITEIGMKSFMPMIRPCTQDAMVFCNMKRDVHLYICLMKRKDNDGLSRLCRPKVETAHEKFAELITEYFPEKQNDQPKILTPASSQTGK